MDNGLVMQNIIHKLRALIVDDELDGREVLAHLLKPFADKVEIVGMARDAEEACALIDSLLPDLVFLDIQMAGKNGFSVLENFAKLDFEVIFVTSFEQYSLTAIKFNALDYLLKPVDVQELAMAVNKAVTRISTKLAYELRINSLLESLNRRKSPKRMAVHVRDSVHMVDLSEVMYILAEGNYCRMVMESGDSFLVSRMLREFEEYLGEFSVFMRINKSTLANPDFMVKYSKGEPCIVTMRDIRTFEVSRRKKQEILDLLKNRDGK